MKSTSRRQLRSREALWEGSLRQIREAMYKNVIQGPASGASEPSVAKPSGLGGRVNGALAWRKWMLLSGEASLDDFDRFKSTGQSEVPSAAMPLVSSKEESAEGIVVV